MRIDIDLNLEDANELRHVLRREVGRIQEELNRAQLPAERMRIGLRLDRAQRLLTTVSDAAHAAYEDLTLKTGA